MNDEARREAERRGLIPPDKGMDRFKPVMRVQGELGNLYACRITGPSGSVQPVPARIPLRCRFYRFHPWGPWKLEEEKRTALPSFFTHVAGEVTIRYNRRECTGCGLVETLTTDQTAARARRGD